MMSNFFGFVMPIRCLLASPQNELVFCVGLSHELPQVRRRRLKAVKLSDRSRFCVTTVLLRNGVRMQDASYYI